MNGVVILVGALVLIAVIKLLIDGNWMGLILAVIAIALVLGIGQGHK